MSRQSVWPLNRPPTCTTGRHTRKAIKDITALERIEPLEDWEGINMQMTNVLYGWSTRLELLDQAIDAWFDEKARINPKLLTHPTAKKIFNDRG